LKAENVKVFEWKVGKTGMLILISGMAFLLCSSFVLGVIVGRNIDTYPGKIASAPQRALTAFLQMTSLSGAGKLPAEKENPAKKKNIDLSFHDTLTSKKPMPENALPTEEKKPQDEVQVYSEKKLPPPEPIQEEPAAVTEKVSPKKPTTTEKPAAEHKEKIAGNLHSETSSFLVQVSSLKDKSKAVQIHKMVAGMGYSSKLVKMDLKEKGIWYRVVATGFDTKGRAQAAAEKISKKVNTKCIVRAAGARADKKS